MTEVKNFLLHFFIGVCLFTLTIASTPKTSFSNAEGLALAITNSFINLVCVEGHYSRLCLHPGYLLPAVGCSSWGIDLAVHVSGSLKQN